MSLRDYDRTVHACNREAEIVRYDQAGKWYIEYRDGRRKRISIRDAARHALSLYEDGGMIVYGKPGGSMFDRLVPQERAVAHAPEVQA